MLLVPYCYILAPTGVSAPSSVQVLTGFSLYATWNEPSGKTGRLDSFLLRAYNLDDPEITPLEVSYNATVFQGTP